MLVLVKCYTLDYIAHSLPSKMDQRRRQEVTTNIIRLLSLTIIILTFKVPISRLEPKCPM